MRNNIGIGIVLLAVGVCGFLDAAGIVDSARTIGQWWPLLVIVWPLAEMVSARKVTLGGVICAAVGLALLADAQEWAADTVVWSVLAAYVGLAILGDAVIARLEGHDRGGASAQH